MESENTNNLKENLIIYIFSISLIILFIAQGLMIPQKHLFWGFIFDQTFLYLLFSVILIILFSFEITQFLFIYLLDYIYNKIKSLPKFVFPTIMVTFVAILFWTFRINARLGDSWVLRAIGSATLICDGCPQQGLSNLFYKHAPLAAYINAMMVKLLFILGGGVPKIIIAITSVGLGLIFFISIWYFVRILFSDYLRRFLFISFIMTSGFTLLFYGYKEIMQYATPFIALYFITAYLSLKKKLNLIWPTLSICVAFLMHISVGFFFPSLILLYYFKSDIKLKPFTFKINAEVGKAIILGFVLPILLFSGFTEIIAPGQSILTNVGGEIIDFASSLSKHLLPISFVGSVSEEGYPTFSFQHILAIINEHFLIGNITLLLIILLVLKYRKRIFQDRYFWFLFTAYIFFQLYAILLKQITWDYSAIWDWDVFSYLGIPLVFLGGYLLFKHTNKKDMISLGILSILAGLLFTAPFIYNTSNFNDDPPGPSPFWDNDGLFAHQYGLKGYEKGIILSIQTFGRFSEIFGVHKINSEIWIFDSSGTNALFYKDKLMKNQNVPKQPMGVFEKFILPLDLSQFQLDKGQYIIQVRITDEISKRDFTLQFPITI